MLLERTFQISIKQTTLLIIFLVLLINGCAGLTKLSNNLAYENAFIETQLNQNKWRINFSGREVSMQKAIDFSLLKMQQKYLILILMEQLMSKDKFGYKL